MTVLIDVIGGYVLLLAVAIAFVSRLARATKRYDADGVRVMHDLLRIGPPRAVSARAGRPRPMQRWRTSPALRRRHLASVIAADPDAPLA